MASSVFAAVGARPSQLLRPSATAPRIPIISPAVKLSAVKAAAPIDFIRFKKHVLRMQIRERWHAVSASNSNPSGGDSIEDKPGAVKTNDAAQGPPFLTILAGFLVLLLVFWIVGSVLMWLISLIVRFLPSS